MLMWERCWRVWPVCSSLSVSPLHGVTGKERGEDRAEKLGHAFMYGCDCIWFGIHLPPPPDSDEAELESYMRARERFEESRCRAFVADLVAQHQR